MLGLQNKAITLMEIMVVIIIIGIIATLGLPQFAKTKESTLDKEAKANLRLIQAAEKIYHLEHNEYYPDTGSVDNNTNINDNLKLSLTTQNWTYKVYYSGCAQAQRNGDNNRMWSLVVNNTLDPTAESCR